MGILKNGFLMNYSGKIGNLVFYTLNGKQVVRSCGKTKKAPTEPQLRCRQEMRVVVTLVKNITEFINVGFKHVAESAGKLAGNMAVSYNKKNALKGTYPNIAISYERVLVTQGSICGAIDPVVERRPDGLSFSWSCPDSLSWRRPNDQAMLLVYFPVLQKSVNTLYGAKRLAGNDFLRIPDNLLNEYMEVYISFIAEDRRGIADSTYLGNFNY